MRIHLLTPREHFASYENGRFQEAAAQLGLELVLRDPERYELLLGEPAGPTAFYEGEPDPAPTVLLARTGALSTPMALAVMRHRQLAGSLVLNRAAAVACAQDKLATLQRLAAAGLPVPRTVYCARLPRPALLDARLGLPLLAKRNVGSYGLGIVRCDDATQLDDLLGLLAGSPERPTDLHWQELVQSSLGRDVRVVTIGRRAVGAMLRRARPGGYKANFSSGGSVAHFPLAPPLAALAVRAAGLLGLDVAGVDLLCAEQGLQICEVNSAPGFRGFEQATGLDVPRLLLDHAQERVRLRERRRPKERP